MPESFFRRWSRRKSENAQNGESADNAHHARLPDANAERVLVNDDASSAACRPASPSMKDVASLAPDADYSAFLARGVDKSVRRAAMKKLFSDPHFNVMDGLDIYIDDYTRPSPLPPGMLAALQHAKSTLEPKPLYKTQEEEDSERGPAGQADDEDGARNEAPDDGPEEEADVEQDAAGPHAEAQVSAANGEPLSPAQLPPRDAPNHSTELPPP